MGIPESKIGTVLGDSSLDERETVIKKIETGEINVIISSKIFDKGVSANKINVLHNYFPTKEVANTIQRAGRISRTAVGKSYAIVYDYIHDQLGRLYTLTKKCVDY